MTRGWILWLATWAVLMTTAVANVALGAPMLVSALVLVADVLMLIVPIVVLIRGPRKRTQAEIDRFLFGEKGRPPDPPLPGPAKPPKPPRHRPYQSDSDEEY